MKAKQFNEALAMENQGEHEFFVEEPHMKVRMYSGSFSVTDLTNAMKVGKTCESFSVNFNGNNPCHGFNVLNRFGFNVEKFFEFLRALPWEKSRWGGWAGMRYEFEGEPHCYIHRNEEKGVRVYSPYSTKEMKPLKEAPKKWTVRHALRALFNGQYEYVRCRGIYTDDYAFDAACNYRKGEINGEAFARDIMESPSGWWASGNTGGEDGVVAVCCHSFNSNEFKFKVA